MTSCGAVALRVLIGFFHNAFYNGTFSIWCEADISERPSRFLPRPGLARLPRKSCGTTSSSRPLADFFHNL
jgi:hypothetical protein